MQIDLTPTEEAEIRRQAVAAGYESVERYLVDLAVNPEATLPALTEEELKASAGMCDRGMAEIDSGMGKTVEEAREELLRPLREQAG